MFERAYADRDEAGRLLGETVAAELGVTGGPGRPLVLGLPRGGVPVAARVAEALGGNLDVVVARKIAAPGRPEYGVGAIAEDGPPVFDRAAGARLGLTENDRAGTVQRERAELARRVLRYRGDRLLPDPSGRVVIVVDDGIATGVTARAALRWLHAYPVNLLVMAAPVGSREAGAALAEDADLVICPRRPARFVAVGAWYADFTQLTDDDVVRELASYGA